MVFSALKISFNKQKSQILTYHDYNRSDNEKFRESLIIYFSTTRNISYAFQNLVLHTLDKMAPIKQKYIRSNQSPFMNKDIHKTIMIKKTRKILCCFFIIVSEFGYYPLVLMFYSRKLNSRVNKLHKRALRIVYQDYASSFTELLDKVRLTTIRKRNIQLLPTELFKVI